MNWILENFEFIVGSIITILGIIFGTNIIIKRNIQINGKNSNNTQIGEINHNEKK